MKKLIFLSSFLLVCGATLGFFYDKLEQQMMPKSSNIKVVGLPAGYEPQPVHESYQGPHPAAITRPDEHINFPIAYGQVGPTEALFAGDNQYPFLCGTQKSGLGQPLVDNQSQEGISIYSGEGLTPQTEITGYSKDCSLPTTVQYFVKDEALKGYRPIEEEERLASDKNEFIRVETGTINRFIYVLALPVSKQDAAEDFDGSKWNNRLIYRFKGGVGVGRQQGYVRIPRLLYEHEEQLQQGYALAFSTGTQTSNHYDIWLSEDTALRVKRQFASRYGEPIYTIGIGGSGGAIQQYLLAQNRPGIIDGAIPLYSYPDMVSQVGYALDCELTEYYFDVTSDDDKWTQWQNRSLIQGSNALHDFKNRYGNLQGIASSLNGDFSHIPGGATECTNGWRGPAQVINNPRFYSHYHAVDKAVFDQVDWSHWSNLKHIYGTHENGLSRRFWSNSGVQYGLGSLLSGQLSASEFVHLNTYIGGWKAPEEMGNERFWHVSGDDSLRRFSVWGQHNMTHDGKQKMGPRSEGNQEAIKAAYHSGLVFLGKANLPIIDLRHYLDHQLDMHHSVASFTSRKRIEYAMGSSEHQLIWMMEKDDTLSRANLMRSLPVGDALRVLDQWIINMRTYPTQSVAQNRPKGADDRCYDKAQQVMASGETVWDGDWNSQPMGDCQRIFPHYTNSRLMAGDNLYGDTLSCDKVSIKKAVEMGMYGDANMAPYVATLEQVFPSGVCYFGQQPHGHVRNLIQTLKSDGLLMSVAPAKKEPDPEPQG